MRTHVSGRGGAAAVLLVAVLSLSGCSSNLRTGALGGAAAGAVVGGLASGTARGAIIGAAVGGLAGHEIAGDGDKVMGTVLGAIGGGLLGRAIDRGDLKCR